MRIALDELRDNQYKVAKACLWKAIDLDARFGLAWSALATFYSQKKQTKNFEVCNDAAAKLMGPIQSKFEHVY